MAKRKQKKRKNNERQENKQPQKRFWSYLMFSIGLLTLLVASVALYIQQKEHKSQNPLVGLWLDKCIFYGEYDQYDSPYFGFKVRAVNMGRQPITLSPYNIVGIFLPTNKIVEFSPPTSKKVYLLPNSEVFIRMSGTIDLKLTDNGKEYFEKTIREGNFKDLFEGFIVEFISPMGAVFSSQNFTSPEPICGNMIPVSDDLKVSLSPTVCLAGAALPSETAKVFEENDTKRIEWLVE